MFAFRCLGSAVGFAECVVRSHHELCTLCSSLQLACDTRAPPSSDGCLPAIPASGGMAIISHGGTGITFVHCFADKQRLLVGDQIVLSDLASHAFEQGNREKYQYIIGSPLRLSQDVVPGLVLSVLLFGTPGQFSPNRVNRTARHFNMCPSLLNHTILLALQGHKPQLRQYPCYLTASLELTYISVRT